MHRHLYYRNASWAVFSSQKTVCPLSLTPMRAKCLCFYVGILLLVSVDGVKVCIGMDEWFFQVFFPPSFQMKVLFVQVKFGRTSSILLSKNPLKNKLKSSSSKFYNAEHMFQDSLPFCKICTNERVKIFDLGNTVKAPCNILMQHFFKLKKKSISLLSIHT